MPRKLAMRTLHNAQETTRNVHTQKQHQHADKTLDLLRAASGQQRCMFFYGCYAAEW
jgi:hypothetical protein